VSCAISDDLWLNIEQIVIVNFCVY